MGDWFGRLPKSDCLVEETQSGPVAFYFRPADDGSRPGTFFMNTEDPTSWGRFQIEATAYHEGIPGHHLQIGFTMTLGDKLNRYQKITFAPANGEGWALYSERLMDELGYYEDQPAWRMGMLQAGLFRAARVIVDVGMHLEFAIPESSDFCPGEIWSYEHAVEFLSTRSHEAQLSLQSEVTRYLGWPAQAITYKLGERAWLAAREQARQRQGGDFSLKAFHHNALELGPLGLDQLVAEMARI
ncbi:MAG: DUF885 domain-containing protein, partial [Acidimicrobiales bacterium]